MAKRDVKESVNLEDTELPSDFEEKARRRAELAAEIKALESEKEPLDEYLKSMMDAFDVEKVRFGSFTASISRSVRSTIVAERLLEEGVDPRVIEKATKTTPSISFTVKEDKE
jgi:predicted phage-related endonuclease